MTSNAMGSSANVKQYNQPFLKYETIFNVPKVLHMDYMFNTLNEDSKGLSSAKE
jgi:hypothetical protein